MSYDIQTNEGKKAEIARLENMRAMSERMGSGYGDRIREIDKRLTELRG